VDVVLVGAEAETKAADSQLAYLLTVWGAMEDVDHLQPAWHGALAVILAHFIHVAVLHVLSQVVNAKGARA
jgi:hypothetical protein